MGSPHGQSWAYHLGGEYLFLFQSQCVLLRSASVCILWDWPTPLPCLSPVRKGQNPPLSHKKGARRPISYPGRQEELLALGDWQSLQKLISLCWSKALLQPVLNYIVFSLYTLIPRCGRHKCVDFYSWWQATDATCLTEIYNKIMPFMNLTLIM